MSLFIFPSIPSPSTSPGTNLWRIYYLIWDLVWEEWFCLSPPSHYPSSLQDIEFQTIQPKKNLSRYKVNAPCRDKYSLSQYNLSRSSVPPNGEYTKDMACLLSSKCSLLWKKPNNCVLLIEYSAFILTSEWILN